MEQPYCKIQISDIYEIDGIYDIKLSLQTLRELEFGSNFYQIIEKLLIDLLCFNYILSYETNKKDSLVLHHKLTNYLNPQLDYH